MSVQSDFGLAQQAARGDTAHAILSTKVFANARRRTSLAKRILRLASDEHRTLYARFFGSDYTSPDGWRLLITIAGRKNGA